MPMSSKENPRPNPQVPSRLKENEAERHVEYGINFPDGTEEWPHTRSNTKFWAYENLDLSTQKGRGEAQDLFDTNLVNAGIKPSDDLKLQIIKRTRHVYYSAVELVK